MESVAQQWRDAIADVVIRHPNRESRVVVDVSDGDPPSLSIALDKTRDSRDPERVMAPFCISNVKLTYFPGVRLARKWLAAAFAGYAMHEALELVTVGGLTDRPIDPHEPPFTNDMCLRVGLPVQLTPETLLATLALVMPRDAAEALVAHG